MTFDKNADCLNWSSNLLLWIKTRFVAFLVQWREHPSFPSPPTFQSSHSLPAHPRGSG